MKVSLISTVKDAGPEHVREFLDSLRAQTRPLGLTPQYRRSLSSRAHPVLAHLRGRAHPSPRMATNRAPHTVRPPHVRDHFHPTSPAGHNYSGSHAPANRHDVTS